MRAPCIHAQNLCSFSSAYNPDRESSNKTTLISPVSLHNLFNFGCVLNGIGGSRGRVAVDALCYKKVAGSIADEVTRFFNLPNPSSRTMALGSTQSRTEMSTRNLPGE
jgi:hypothetical protein